MLSETSVNVALSNLMSVFSVSVASVQWLVTGFMLVMAIVVPITAFIIQSYDDRKIYFVSLALVIAGTTICAFAPSFAVILAGRLIQAAGTCVMMSLTVNVMLALSSAKDRGSAMGLIALVILLAPAISPSLAGIILQELNWQWIFIATLPLLVAVGLLAYFWLEDVTPRARLPFCGPSFVLEAIAFGCLLYGLSSFSEHTSGSTHGSLIAIGVGILALAAFVLRQLKLERPLLDVRVFKYPMFTVGMITVFFGMLTVFGTTVLLPILYINAFALPAAMAGLALLPAGLLNGMAAPIIGALYDKGWAKLPALIGIVVLTMVACFYTTIVSSTPVWIIILAHIIAMVSAVTIMTIAQSNGLNHLPRELHPHGIAINSTLMQLGGAVGSAFYVTFYAIHAMSSHATEAEAVTAGFRGAYLYGAIALIIPLAAAFFVTKKGIPAGDEHAPANT